MSTLARVVSVFLLGSLSVACGLDQHGDAAGNPVGPSGGRAADSGVGGAATGGQGAEGGGGAPTGGTGAGGSTGAEHCTDGVDNDGDGAVDCADPDCGEFSCVPALPAGFTGYLRVRGESFPPAAADGPTCPDGAPPTRYMSDPIAPSCTSCACGALSGAACSAAGILCTHGASDCSGAQSWSGKLGGSCSNGDYTEGTLSCYATPGSVTAQGSCAPVPSQLQDTDLFSNVQDACRQPHGQGCGAGQACVKNGSGDYGGFVCVEQPGEVSCPSEYGVRIVAYQSGVDQRTCGSCQCTPQQVSCDAPDFSFYDGLGCSGSKRSVTSNACQNLSSLLDWGTWSYKTTHQPAPFGSCSAQGGAPQGSVVGVGAITFCCRSVL